MWAVQRFEGLWKLCSVYLALAARCVFRAAPLSVLRGIKAALNIADWRTIRRMLQSSFIHGDSTFLALWPHLLTKRRGWYAACHSGVVWALSLSGSEGKSEKQIFPVCAHVFVEMFGFAWGEEWSSERRVIDGISIGMKAKGQKCWYKKSQEDVFCMSGFFFLHVFLSSLIPSSRLFSKPLILHRFTGEPGANPRELRPQDEGPPGWGSSIIKVPNLLLT